MPNEVTGMDTVKALFVRAFPRKLAMPMLDLPQRKIYIRDPVTEIFYELEKLEYVKLLKGRVEKVVCRGVYSY